MKRTTLLIGILLLTNCVTLIGWYSSSQLQAYPVIQEQSFLAANEEVIATVGEERITRNDWLYRLESEVGEKSLQELVDERVLDLAAERYDLNVSKEEIALEESLTDLILPSDLSKEKQERERAIYYDLLFQKLVSKDVNIGQSDIESYYKTNQHLFEVPDKYDLSLIKVPSLKDGKRIVAELSTGADFESLAREQSTDPYSAEAGGKIGFLFYGNTLYPEEMWEEVKGVKAGKWSNVFQWGEEYAIVYVHQIEKGTSYSLKEVSGYIERKLAKEVRSSPVSVGMFYDEFDVQTFYDQKR
ncbi:peptidyl-prolyl cis-trans isomerase [Bacillus coahuilensis]|uniref:peptidyl-prolyl cis-trans isomerase n=1 Tax=Bacillus coahuilensis TaxID=408580 RepID=UPI0007504AD2|nr:peptidyl-prolyl cis-trans isomerase [Bacillus coahuilensis]